MRLWPVLFLLLAPTLLRAQHPHLDLPPSGSPQRIQLFGMVTDSLTRKPVYDCLVGYYDASGKRLSITSVNSDGRFALFIPAGVPYELRVERENGYVELHRAMPPAPNGLALLRQDLVLLPK